MADGINKEISIKKESTWGTKPAASGAQLLPRVTGNFQGEKDTYQSALLKPSQQLSDSRHGTRRATGSLSGELMCSAYSLLIAAALRRDFPSTAVTTGALTNITVSDAYPAFTRASGSFLTDGFRNGMVVDVTNPSETDNAARAVVVEATALTLDLIRLDGGLWVNQASGDTITIAQVGEMTYTPASGHTNDSFSIEEWHSDIALSQITLGQQVNSMSISVSPNSMAALSFDFLGKDFEATSGTRYFTSPTAVPGEGTMSAPDGVVIINGQKSCRLTSFSLTVNNNITQESLVGCSGIGARSRGKVMASGSMTVILDDGTYQDYFNEEAEVEFSYTFNAADDEAFSIYIPRMKIGSVTKDDGEKVILLTVPFDCLEYVGTDTAILNTTVVIHDTTL